MEPILLSKKPISQESYQLLDVPISTIEIESVVPNANIDKAPGDLMLGFCRACRNLEHRERRCHKSHQGFLWQTPRGGQYHFYNSGPEIPNPASFAVFRLISVCTVIYR